MAEWGKPPLPGLDLESQAVVSFHARSEVAALLTADQAQRKLGGERLIWFH